MTEPVSGFSLHGSPEVGYFSKTRIFRVLIENPIQITKLLIYLKNSETESGDLKIPNFSYCYFCLKLNISS